MNQKVSIVIIGRNEERGIEKCVRAALAAAEQIGGAEMIFVDSASTDSTVETVRALGVRVVSLKPDWELSPSAGRFIGSRCAAGEFVLFLDADTLIYRDFLPAAIKRFEQNPAVAGINGQIDDKDENDVLLSDVEDRSGGVMDVKWLRGPACFYRRAALVEAGSFNPYLKVEEEAELGLRLIKKGWRLQIIPLPMACHTRCYHLQTVASVISAWRRDIVSKRGGALTNTMAYAFREGNGLAFCWLRLKTTIIFLGWLSLLILCLLLPTTFHPLQIFAAFVVLGLAAIFIEKRDAAQVWVFILAKTLNFVDVLMGVHRIKIKSSSLYPLDVVERS
ncbi:MAG: glycosyltransferase [Pyrinomonadaceae bacterium]|nr:glycosyltransferase [Pyrinomonadaceae bacterium]